MRRLGFLLALLLASPALATTHTFRLGVCCDDRAGTTNCVATNCDDDGDCSGGQLCSGSAADDQDVESVVNCVFGFSWNGAGGVKTCQPVNATTSSAKTTMLSSPVQRCYSRCSLLCFDTSSLDPGVTYAAGSNIQLDVTSLAGTLGPFSIYGQWQQWQPCGAEDYTASPSGNAFSHTLIGLTTGVQTFTLNNMSNVRPGGLAPTCFRICINPAGNALDDNRVTWASRDSTTAPGPVLELNVVEPAATSTPTLTPTATLTPTSANTATATATATGTPTNTTTPNHDYGQLFLHGGSFTDTSTYLMGDNQATTIDVARYLPIAIRVRDLYVECGVGPGAGKTLTATVVKNGSLVTGEACTMTGAGNGAGVSWCNATLTNNSTLDFAVDDKITVALVQTTGTATAANCVASLGYRASGDAGEAPDLYTGGSDVQYNAVNGAAATYNQAVGTSSGGPFSNTTAFGQATLANALRLVPTTGTLTAFSIRADAYTGTGTHTLLSGAGAANTTDLAGVITSGTLRVEDTTCTSNCAVIGGDAVVAQVVQTGADSGNRRRNWTAAISGMGQPFWGTVDVFGNATSKDIMFGPAGIGGSSGAPGHEGAFATAKAVTIQNLRFRAVGALNAGTIITLYAGSAPNTMTATELTCSVGAGTDVTCENTSRHIGIAKGQFLKFNALATGTPGTPRPIHAVVELSSDATETPTPNPAWTATSTPTNTATATVTPTATGPTPTGTVTQTGTITPTPVDTYTFTPGTPGAPACTPNFG